MTNYERYKLVLADIMIQNYKTDGEKFYTPFEGDESKNIKDITFDWLLSKWNDKEWKPEILFNLTSVIAIDNSENDIILGLCACADISCVDCAFGDIYSWGCVNSIRYWLEDETNEVIK